MDLAQQLVRSCVRSFYDTKHILVVDALVIHSAYVRVFGSSVRGY